MKHNPRIYMIIWLQLNNSKCCVIHKIFLENEVWKRIFISLIYGLNIMFHWSYISNHIKEINSLVCILKHPMLYLMHNLFNLHFQQSKLNKFSYYVFIMIFIPNYSPCALINKVTFTCSNEHDVFADNDIH